MKFRYIASQLDGKVIESEIDAKDTKEVLQFLSSRGLKPISIRILRSESGKGFFSGRKINIEDQIFISKYLALMLKLGTGLIQAINILIDDFDKKVVRSFLIEVKNNLEGGMPFYSVFAKYPKTFSQVYINLIKAGEASGNLDSVFENLTTSLTKEKGLKDSIKSALIYPVLLVVASLSILIFLVMYALPKISKVFEQGGFEPPLFSRIVFSVGLFFADYGFYIIGFFVLLFIFLFFLYKNSVIFKRFVYGVFDGIPVIKNLIHKIALQRFAAVLSSLIKAGIPLVNALEITADTVGNIALKDAILRISKEGLMKGVTVGEAFKKEPIFPRTVVNLIAVSEKTGHMEDVLATLADFYSSEVDNSLKSLVAFLEPAMLVMIGGIIGLIALSIIVPIYQLTTQF
jgi:type II secretory pathway component PulF